MAGYKIVTEISWTPQVLVRLRYILLIVPDHLLSKVELNATERQPADTDFADGNTSQPSYAYGLTDAQNPGVSIPDVRTYVRIHILYEHRR